MSIRSLLFALPIVALTSCFVDVPDIDTNVFACETDGDCAGGYVCKQSLGVCLRTCKGSEDCPEATPNCVNGTCGDACADMEGQCSGEGKVCKIANGAPTCVTCDQNDFSCKFPNRACVLSATAVEEPICVPTCDGGYPTCDSPKTGFMAHCVSVKLAKSGGGNANVCATCPDDCSNNCSSTANPPAPAYLEATTCGGNVENCFDDADNDDDGKIDCADPDCAADPGCAERICGAMICTAGSICVSTGTGGTTCMPSCSSPGEPCEAFGNTNSGHCITTYFVGNPRTVCVGCGTGGCAWPTDTCMVYGGTTFPNVDAAKDNAVCACPPVASGWYAIGGSACGDGLVNIAPNPVNGRGPSMALSNEGIPFVAFTDQNPKAQVWRWNPSVRMWNPAASTGSPVMAPGGAGDSQQPEIAFLPAGETIGLRITWIENWNGKPQVYWARLDPSTETWVAEGTDSNKNGGISSDSASFAKLPSLALSANNQHVIAWEKNDSSIEVRYWPGTGAWVQAGTNVPTGGITGATAFHAPRPAIASDNTVVFLTWQSYTGTYNYISARRWSFAGVWTSLESSVEPPGVSAVTSVGADSPAIAVAGMEPVVVWHAASTPTTIRIRRHESNEWKGYGSDTTFSQVSLDPDPPLAPAVAMLPSDEPLVAFEANRGGRWRIVVTRWSSLMTQWEALGDSMGDDGISHPTIGGHLPSIVVGTSPRDHLRDAVCVSWIHGTGASARPYLRCYDL